MTIQTGEATFQLSQTLLVCLGYPDSSDNIALYIERHGVSGLATAVLVSAPPFADIVENRSQFSG
jgi:hypothetical protein